MMDIAAVSVDPFDRLVNAPAFVTHIRGVVNEHTVAGTAAIAVYDFKSAVRILFLQKLRSRIGVVDGRRHA